jgi:hypothetical protein
MYEGERGMEGEVAEWQRALRAALCLRGVEWVGNGLKGDWRVAV